VVRAAVALGSNLGDRAAHLDFAISRLRLLLSNVLASSYYETAPVGVGGPQPPFPAAPRTLDLDLVLYGDAILDEPGLAVPHPRFRDRRFVLQPLAAIAPHLRDPVTGKTMKELLDRLAVIPGDR